MGFIFDPASKPEALQILGQIMLRTKKEMEHSLPFAMDPVVFDYRVNGFGTVAELKLVQPEDEEEEEDAEQEEDGGSGSAVTNETSADQADSSASSNTNSSSSNNQNLDNLLEEQGFDMKHQEQIRSDLRKGVIGLAKNRLPLNSQIEDVTDDDVIFVNSDHEGADESQTNTDTANTSKDSKAYELGQQALLSGSIGILTLSPGVGSLEKEKDDNREDDPIGPIYISKGKSIGLRLIPTLRDLKFHYHQQSSQKLDEQAQKVRDSVHSALLNWAKGEGEGCDYRANVPKQCVYVCLYNIIILNQLDSNQNHSSLF